MRMGPGKHLKGKTLLNGVVTPEEVRLKTTCLRRFPHALLHSSTTSTRLVTAACQRAVRLLIGSFVAHHHAGNLP